MKADNLVDSRVDSRVDEKAALMVEPMADMLVDSRGILWERL